MASESGQPNGSESRPNPVSVTVNQTGVVKFLFIVLLGAGLLYGVFYLRPKWMVSARLIHLGNNATLNHRTIKCSKSSQK